MEHELASSRLEVLLQHVLEKVDGLERQIADQNSRLKAAQDRQDATDASLKDVVKFAAEDRARRVKQEWQQIKFVSVIHVVASVGFVKEVLVCFSLNRSTWIDVYKHTERRPSRYNDSYYHEKFEETRLLRQCRRGRESSVERLLRLGANLHIRNYWGDPALSVASGLGRTRLVSALIAAGADVNFRGGREARAAVERIHPRPVAGTTALMWAAKENHPEAITVLVNAGANMNQENEQGETALMLAKTEAAKTLLALGADVNYASAKTGKTALMTSACGMSEKTKMFIDASADLNHASGKGRTAIFYAARSGDFRSLKLLIDAGADVQHTDNQGRTAIFEPAWYYQDYHEGDGHVEVVKMLIDAGLDLHLVPYNGGWSSARCTMNDGETAQSFYTAALQEAIGWLQAHEEEDEEEAYTQGVKAYIANFTQIVALINERIAQLAELAKQADGEVASGGDKGKGRSKGRANGGGSKGKR